MKAKCINCLSTLGEKTRAKLYYTISKNGPITVKQLVEFCDVKQPTVSHHLILLEKAGLINFHKKGRNVFYKIAESCIYDARPCVFQTYD